MQRRGGGHPLSEELYAPSPANWGPVAAAEGVCGKSERHGREDDGRRGGGSTGCGKKRDEQQEGGAGGGGVDCGLGHRE